MEPRDLKHRITGIRALLSHYRVQLVEGEGLELALKKSEAWVDAAIAKSTLSQATSLADAEAASVVYTLSETLENCFRAGLPLQADLRNITTGSIDYGEPAEGDASRQQIYFKDFELELFIAARCLTTMPVRLSDQPNDPLADLHAGILPIQVKHPDSVPRLERNIKRFNAKLRVADRYGIFAAGLEDAFRLDPGQSFSSESAAQEWLSGKRRDMEIFGRSFLECASRCARILATIQVTTFPVIVANGLSISREGNSMIFDRSLPADSTETRDAWRVASAFNPQPRIWRRTT
jgi:hypothetical protein